MLKTDIYPRAGTRAQVVLEYIAQNSGTTTNGIIAGLKFNPSVVRKCLSALLSRKVIVDAQDNKGHHHYSVKKVL